MRRADYYLAGGILALALLLAGLRLLPRAEADCARLTVDGREVARLPLDRADEYTWQQDGAFVTVCVEAGRARVTASSCPDQTCVHMGAVSQQGGSVVCLPNRAVLSAVRTDAPETDAILQ